MFIVLVNRNAGWVRAQHLDRLLISLRRILREDGQVIVTSHAGEVDEALARLEARDVTALVPVGGDGTLSSVLTSACARWGAEQLPILLPLRAGTMNMVALDLRRGRREAPLATLERVVRAHRAGLPPVLSERALLRSDAGHAGFTIGLGIPNRFLAHYYEKGGGFRRALGTLLEYSGSVLLRGELARALFKPLAVTLTLDDQPARSQTLSLLMAVTVDTVPLGFQIGITPQAGGMTLIFGSPDPVRLVASLPLIHRGYLPPSVGLRRVTCRQLILEFAQPQAWQLDGDIMPATQRLVLDTSAKVKMLV